MGLDFGIPDEELTITLHNRRPHIVDNIFKGNPFLIALRTFGMVETIDGGLELVQPLRIAKSTATGSFDGYDLLDTTPQNNLTSAKYPWAQDYATVSLAWTEEMKNQGRGRLLSIVEVKSDDAGLSIRDKLNLQLIAASPAAGSKDPISIDELIPTDPTATPNRLASIGNIAASNVFWRSKTLNGGPFSIADLSQTYNDVSDGSEPPTFALTSQTIYQYYEATQVGAIRYENSRLADAGFEALMYKGKPIIWDPNLAITDRLWWINSMYMKLKIMKGADFVTTKFIEPDNQAAKVAKILWMGNLCSTNRRRLGVIHSITNPA